MIHDPISGIIQQWNKTFTVKSTHLAVVCEEHHADTYNARQVEDSVICCAQYQTKRYEVLLLVYQSRPITFEDCWEVKNERHSETNTRRSAMNCNGGCCGDLELVKT